MAALAAHEAAAPFCKAAHDDAPERIPLSAPARTFHFRTPAAAVCALVVVLAGGVTLSDPASAAPVATLTVTTLADSGPGSLRDAATIASGTPEDDVIGFAAGLTGTIEIDSVLPIGSGTTVAGPGADSLTVRPSEAFVRDGSAVIAVGSVDDARDITMSGLTIDGDSDTALGNFGSDFASLSLGILTLDAVAVNGSYISLRESTGLTVMNSAMTGASLDVNGLSGDLLLRHTAINGNSTIAANDVAGDVTFSGVDAHAGVEEFSWAIVNSVGGTFTIADSTFTGNAGVLNAYNLDGPVVLRDSTFGAPGVDSSRYPAVALSVNGTPVTASNLTFTNRSDALRVMSFSDTRTAPVTMTDITAVTDSPSAYSGLAVYGMGIGDFTASRVSTNGYTLGVNVTGITGAATIEDATIEAGTAQAPYNAFWLSGGVHDVTIDRATVDGYAHGVWFEAFGDDVQAVIRNSTFTAMTDAAVTIVGEEADLTLDAVTVANSQGAVNYMVQGAGRVTIANSTITESFGRETGSAPVVVTNGYLTVSNSTFDQAGTLTDDDAAHFLSVGRSVPAVADGPLATVEHSTFSGAGVIAGFELSPSDEVRLTHVIGDSVDDVDDVRPGFEDVVMAGGHLVVDNSILVSNQLAIEAAATDPANTTFTWGERVQTDVPDAAKNLGPLQNNGGTTSTRVLLDGSVAVGAGDPAMTGLAREVSTDQRGYNRVYGVVDVGAVEMNLGLLQLTPPQLRVTAGAPASLTVNRVAGPDSAYGALSGVVALTDASAEHGVDYSGPQSFDIVIPAGEDAATIATPTTAVDGRGERTLSAALTGGEAATPVDVQDASEITIVHTATSVDHADPPTTPPPAEQLGTVGPAESPSGGASNSATGTDGLAVTGAQVTAAALLAALLIAAGAALAVARRRSSRP